MAKVSNKVIAGQGKRPFTFCIKRANMEWWRHSFFRLKAGSGGSNKAETKPKISGELAWRDRGGTLWERVICATHHRGVLNISEGGQQLNTPFTGHYCL